MEGSWAVFPRSFSSERSDCVISDVVFIIIGRPHHAGGVLQPRPHLLAGRNAGRPLLDAGAEPARPAASA
eukprot:1557814-Lingulodinium_polyedra.AAC.1